MYQCPVAKTILFQICYSQRNYTTLLWWTRRNRHKVFICVCSSCTVNQIKFILFNKIEWTSSLSTVQIIVNANKRAKVSTWEMRREQQQKGQQQAYDIVTFHSHPYILYVYLYRVSIFAINILCHVLKISSQTFNGFSNSSWTFDFVGCESGGDWRAKWYSFMQTPFYRDSVHFILFFDFILVWQQKKTSS